MTRQIKTIYRVSLNNGRFDHVRGKRAAVLRAANMIGYDCTPSNVANNPGGWGVTIEKVSGSTAKAVGLA